MRRCLPVLALLLFWTGSVQARGLLIPEDKHLPPLAMLNHHVTINVDEQVAETKVVQTFRNHTSRNLEATYVFPVPKGASVKRFTMKVGGKEFVGELLEAKAARKVYTDIVRRTEDPGLLEYMGNNLIKLRVFPVLAHQDQEVSVTFTSIIPKDGDLIEYIYPLKTDGKATKTLEKFSIQATVKAQNSIQNVYSPTHPITLSRKSDREVSLTFERDQAPLDKDFLLYYSLGDKDVGLTLMTHRPLSTEKGWFMVHVSPKVDIPKDKILPRDMILVLDTSGSMRGPKMDQARKALRYCLSNLNPQDKFALINFSTTVNKYRDALVDASNEQVEHAKKWVDSLEPAGGTAIDAALTAAMGFRPENKTRTFTVVFFTDGCPTIGETNPDKIVNNVKNKNTDNTRIFTFGVGDDVNATMLDQVSENTKALSTYVRPVEDIEVKVSSLYSKISHPILANLKLSFGKDIQVEDVYPPALPDLFLGGQLTVIGRFNGKGHAAITLTGSVGKEEKNFVYEVNFPDKSAEDKNFVEYLWARRKVGYLLDQIRANGEKKEKENKELEEEVIHLAKKYGIATPYTSYLIVPDGPVPVAAAKPGAPMAPHADAPAALHKNGAARPMSVESFARGAQAGPGGFAGNRDAHQMKELRKEAEKAKGEGKGEAARMLEDALQKKDSFDKANAELKKIGQGMDGRAIQEGKLGVDLSVQMNNLRNQMRMEQQQASRNVMGRNCMEIGGVWIDEGFKSDTKTLKVKAMSDAYFKLLEKNPKLKEVFQLGNHLVWVSPSGMALVIDTNDGKTDLTDEEIESLLKAK